MLTIETTTRHSINKNLAQMSCQCLRGVGEKQAARLAKCNIYSVQDLLFHLPYRYQDRTRIQPINSLIPGTYACIQGNIIQVKQKQGRRPSLLCTLRDHSSFITLRFFHLYANQQATLLPGTCLHCFGEVRLGPAGLEMIHPEFQPLSANHKLPQQTNLTPIYPSTEGLKQQSLRNLTDQALQLLQEEYSLTEYLPESLLVELKLPDLKQALLYIHRPPADAVIEELETGRHPAQQRLAFEELLAHQLCLRRLRHKLQYLQAPRLLLRQQLTSQLLQQLPFQLTAAQQRVSAEIAADLQQTHPMLRLVQGDVGSGKTIVAVLAILQALENGYQAALMAPTELLTEQHIENLNKWLAPLNKQVVGLLGKLSGKVKKQILAEIASGQAHVIVGTHALYQQGVQFAQLGLCIIDEQHRFGVHQRLALREKGAQGNLVPHQLIMTATPIPRTLAMTAYADLDISIIDSLPPGRTPIQTVVIENSRRHAVIERIRNACLSGRQSYWVCTLIEESEVLQCEAAEATAKQLQQALPELQIGLIHGRLKQAEKLAIMQDFKAAKIDLLVATTVIEVGVDVPNASLMIIENPERLGLAQLHQLRGRIGRGSIASHCVLLYQAPLSAHAKERLTVMREYQDGFIIAQRDLELRGPGEFLGTRQTGLLQLRIANLTRDQHLLAQVQAAADKLLQSSPQVVDPLIQRWLTASEVYGHV
jgi:ATP-dependent DNA helicase RecG